MKRVSIGKNKMRSITESDHEEFYSSRLDRMDVNVQIPHFQSKTKLFKEGFQTNTNYHTPVNAIFMN